MHVAAPPDRVWREFGDFDRMQRWWGDGSEKSDSAGPRGQRLRVYEARLGGRIETELMFASGPSPEQEHTREPATLGGRIVVFEAERELTFEADFVPARDWERPTLMTIRLSPALDGTVVELMHHGFENTGPSAASEHARYEAHWTIAQLANLRVLASRPA